MRRCARLLRCRCRGVRARPPVCVGIVTQSDTHLAICRTSRPLIKSDLDLVIVVCVVNDPPADFSSQLWQLHVVGHVPSDLGEADSVGVARDLDEDTEPLSPDDSPRDVGAGGESCHGLGPRLTHFLGWRGSRGHTNSDTSPMMAQLGGERHELERGRRPLGVEPVTAVPRDPRTIWQMSGTSAAYACASFGLICRSTPQRCPGAGVRKGEAVLYSSFTRRTPTRATGLFS